jgi:hypothetical protein
VNYREKLRRERPATAACHGTVPRSSGRTAQGPHQSSRRSDVSCDLVRSVPNLCAGVPSVTVHRRTYARAQCREILVPAGASSKTVRYTRFEHFSYSTLKIRYCLYRRDTISCRTVAVVTDW